jgi:large subunit ribosomal protein L18
MSTKKVILRKRRAGRVRAKISGTSERPRLCVFRSLKSFYAQIIDDESGKVLTAANLKQVQGAKNNIEGAAKVGELIAKKAIELKITEVVFDRRGYLYHGKVKALADAARTNGLKF